MSVVCGNTKRKTPVEHDKTSFVYADVFHFLIKGAKSAVLEVLLKEEEKIGNDKEVGSFKVRWEVFPCIFIENYNTSRFNFRVNF